MWKILIKVTQYGNKQMTILVLFFIAFIDELYLLSSFLKTFPEVLMNANDFLV